MDTIKQLEGENTQLKASKNEKVNLKENQNSEKKTEGKAESKNQVDNPSMESNRFGNSQEVLKERIYKENISFSHAPGKLLSGPETITVIKPFASDTEDKEEKFEKKFKELEVNHRILEENYRETLKKLNELEIENEDLLKKLEEAEKGENDRKRKEYNTERGNSECNCKREIQKTLEEELKTLEKANCLL